MKADPDHRRQGGDPPAALPCLVCGRELESVASDEQTPNHPYKGTVFTTHGHYGSTVFDSMPLALAEEYLEITVCDGCLVKHRDRILHARLVARERKRFDYKSWNPVPTGG